MDSQKLKDAIRSKYAWPGGYPLALLMGDSETVCMDCARKEYKQIARANRDRNHGGERWPDRSWTPEAVFINWEDTNLYCAHCSKHIESAYGDSEDD